MTHTHIGRWLFTAEGIAKGCLRLDGDQVEEVCYGDTPSDSSRSIVLPGFVNAHTHVGDSFAFPAPKGTVEELVAPPDGYKHRMLRTATRETKLTAMTDAVEIMAATGTMAFIDFREEGVAGVMDLLSAVRSAVPVPVVLGRPGRLPASDLELDEVLASCDGLGLSALRDMDQAQAVRMASRARSAGRMFALHASEAVREDIDRILDLRPDFLVHMTSASDDDIQACADEGVPVVVCPRSNEFFGLDPGIPRLLAAGVEVALGTDNGMIARPDMLSELQAAHRLSGGDLSPSQTVHLATFGGRKVLNAKGKITTGIGISDDLVVMDVRGSDPLGEVVTSAGSSSVSAVIHGGRLRRPENWTR
jgi:cytosine/adenosine deaminase-related metal-dependent hydrolase